MKFLALLFTLVVTLNSTMVDNFEGKIIYKTSYKSKLPNVSDEQFAIMMGTRQDYSFKGGAYKTESNGTMLKWQVFINQDNKLYTKLSTSESIYWNDASENGDEIVTSEIKKNVTTVLGYPCDELTITSKKSVEKYYFASAIKVNPALYVNHKYGHFDEVTRKAKALPLKMIVSNDQFVLESVATEILPSKLDDAVFTLPAGVKTEKSPF